jgi:hypothetical protein
LKLLPTHCTHENKEKVCSCTQKHHTEVRCKNPRRRHRLNRGSWTTGGRILGQGVDQEGPDVDSARDRLGIGADLFLDSVHLLAASVGSVTLGNYGGVDMPTTRWSSWSSALLSGRRAFTDAPQQRHFRKQARAHTFSDPSCIHHRPAFASSIAAFASRA